MKRIYSGWKYIWLAGWALLAAACTESDPLQKRQEETDLAITLRAGSSSGQSRAAIDEGDLFSPLLLCSDREGDYSTLRWQETVRVTEDGVVNYPGQAPVYPHYGDFIYITGLHPAPEGGGLTNGTASWRLDGTVDLMYAPQLSGNRWDGFRIQGNTDASLNKVLQFNHQLTQIRFAAVRQANTIGSNEFRITRITLKAVPRQASFSVTGTPEDELAVSFSDPADLDVPLLADPADPGKTVLITSTDPDQPDAIGSILLPPAEKYIADIETTLGTFLGREVKSEEGNLEKGFAHEIIFHLSEEGLNITGVQLEDWMDENGGDVNVN
ncbi:fimbrillin family protein [Parabacteroides segnis]|uniref:fimbrillin family protein n=1 Tax=Parabacteroides segnis TaxID=2763058 RepID=UPI00351298A6